MRSLVTAIILSLAAVGAAYGQTPPKALSQKDADFYARAFAAVRQGQFAVVSEVKRHVADTCLVGRLAYLKLMHPDYHAEFDELKAWLTKYKDQPDADKVYALALKRRPGSPLQSLAPGGDGSFGSPLGRTETGGITKPKTAVNPKAQAAREAFYNNGDLRTAFALATKSGEYWIGGLAAYRLGQYSVAVERFGALSTDRTQNDWVRSAAAYWAARSSIAAGEPEKALNYLRSAARTPYTFYGLIAERQLGLEPAVKAEGYDLGSEETPVAVAAPRPVSAPLSDHALAKFIKVDKRAKRAAALLQIGQKSDANEELRVALRASATDTARQRWQALAGALGTPLSSFQPVSARQTFDISDYQTPSSIPLGGYTQERALIYAIIRQESHFNPDAASSAGAYGLMQVTPATAAYNAGVSASSIDSSLLLDPATNMRLGQDYVGHLLAQTQGDILRTVAAYNAGPKGIGKLSAAMPEADSLLLIESLAGAETREYVQRVMSNYWIYRQLLSQPSPTLDAAADGSKAVLAVLDQTAPDPGPAALDAASAPSVSAVVTQTATVTTASSSAALATPPIN